MDYIERDVTLNISGKSAKFDDMVYIFKGDRDIQLNIKIIDTKMKFNRTNALGNILTPLPKGCYAKVGLVKPKGGAPVIRDRVKIEDDKVKFLIDSTVCDELDEVGIHKIQIQIYALDDNASPRWTLPSAAELEVCKPDVDFDGITPIVGSAKAGLSMTLSTGDTTIVDFNPDGTYNKTTWANGDIISSEKLNKIENVLEHNVNNINLINSKISGITTPDGVAFSGTQYIDTGYTPNANTKVVADMMPTDSTSYSSLFGVSNYFRVQLYSLDDTVKGSAWLNACKKGIFNLNAGGVRVNNYLNYRHKYVLDMKDINYSMEIDDIPVSPLDTSTTPDEPSSLTMCIFASYNETLLEGISSGVLYNFKIFENDVLLHEYVPAKNNNVVCLYDTVTKTYLQATGEGSLTYVAGNSYNKAVNSSIDDDGNYFTSTNVEGALQELGVQCKEIAKDLLLEDGKLYLKKSDGTKLGVGVILPVSGSGGSITWETLSGKPSTFTPSEHQHSKSEITDFPTIPIVTNDLTNALKTNYDSAYTHSTSSHAPSNAQKNSDITKEEIETKLVGEISTHSHAINIPTDSLITINIVGTTLTLTTDKYQTTTMVDGTEIVLPTVTKFTEIHLFFSATTDMTLILPSAKWQSQPTISANKTYELIFTYTTEWLGGVVVYE